MRIVRPAPDVTRGYMPMKAEVLVRSRGGGAPGDLNESLMIGPVDVTDAPYYTVPAAGRHFARNLWPARAGRAAGRLRTLLPRRWSARDRPHARCSRSRSTCASATSTDVDRHISGMRVLNYPAPAHGAAGRASYAPARTATTAASPSSSRGRPGGLQVWQARRVARRRRIARRFVVNIGDLMARLDQRPLGLDAAPRRQPAA